MYPQPFDQNRLPLFSFGVYSQRNSDRTAAFKGRSASAARRIVAIRRHCAMFERSSICRGYKDIIDLLCHNRPAACRFAFASGNNDRRPILCSIFIRICVFPLGSYYFYRRDNSMSLRRLGRRRRKASSVNGVQMKDAPPAAQTDHGTQLDTL